SGLRRVLELLPADRDPGHCAALHDDEGSHALVVLAFGGRVVLPSARPGAGACRTGARSGCSGDGDRGRVRTKFEIALGELIEGAPISEEVDRAETRAADLEPDVHLCQGHIADVDPLPKHAAGAVRPADDEAALADAGEDGIAVAFLKECSARSGFLED